MLCPNCASTKGRPYCTDSRDTSVGRRRRYSCGCGYRFSTIEVIGEGARGLPIEPANTTLWKREFLDAIEHSMSDLLALQRRILDRIDTGGNIND